MKKILAILGLFSFISVQSQSWQAFTNADSLLFEINDPGIATQYILPLVDGLENLSPDFAMHPLYGLRLSAFNVEADSSYHWHFKPVNSLLYSNTPPSTSYGFFPLKKVIQKNDSIYLNGEDNELRFSLNAMQGIEYFAGNLGSNLKIYLKRGNAYFISHNGSSDSLIEFSSRVYNLQMVPQSSHPLHNKNIIKVSKNRGIIQFPNMHFLPFRLVLCSQKNQTALLAEDIFHFDIGDIFLFRNQYDYRLDKVIAKEENDSAIIYQFFVENSYSNTSTFFSSIPKNKPLLDYIFHPATGPYNIFPLYMDSIASGSISGCSPNEYTFIQAIPELQGRKIIYAPFTNPVLNNTEAIDGTRVYIEGVGSLSRSALVTYYSPPDIQIQENFKILVAYKKANGDEFGSIDNFKLNENMYTPFNLFPNPSYGYLNLSNQSPYSIEKITIMDINGKKVMEENRQVKPGHQESLDINNLKKGIYTIHLLNSDGMFTILKIIKI